METPIITTTVPVAANARLVFESEYIDGKKMDTSVYIRSNSNIALDVYLCVIAGDTIDSFVKDFEEVIKKHRI